MTWLYILPAAVLALLSVACVTAALKGKLGDRNEAPLAILMLLPSLLVGLYAVLGKAFQ